MTGREDDPPLRDDYAVLCAAVREASGLAEAMRVHGTQSWNKTPGHPVTDADIAVNELLKVRLTAARPHYGWLSEETPDDSSRRLKRKVWVVDPIDGTRAFLRGVPEFTVCAALVEDGRPVAGVVSNPATGDVFEAVAGGGARWNGRHMRIGVECPLAKASVLGSSKIVQDRTGPLDGTKFRKVHSIAYRLALVASGEADATVAMNTLNDWDLAAAELLVLEAGGAVSDCAGETLHYNGADSIHDGVVAGAEPLRAEIVARLCNI